MNDSNSTSPHPVLLPPIPAQAQKVLDGQGRSARASLDKPPKGLPRRMNKSREEVEKISADYRSKIAEERAAGMEKGSFEFGPPPLVDTLEEVIKSDAYWHTKKGIEDGPDIVLGKSLRELVPYFDRFDWRAYSVVPKFREQNFEALCWVCTATEAFESGLMIQRANFPALSSSPFDFRKEQVVLNVNSTEKRVRNGQRARHETAFAHYIRTGIPLDEIKINDFEGRDAPLNDVEGKRRKMVKAIAWDWVHPKPWRTPADEESITMLKEALLTHGPLAVMVSATPDFNAYGRAVKNDNVSESELVPGKNLIFQANTVTVEKEEKTGKQFLKLLSDGWSVEGGGGLVIRFAADSAPVFEPETQKGIKPRPTDRDDIVTFDSERGRLGFTVNNAVIIEKDPETGEVKVCFPPNTSAQFTKSETGDLVVKFPNDDDAPVFVSKSDIPQELLTPSHYVLLIGWDQNKCAWIIQNTFTNWGYQCNGPNVGMGFEDRGYMYIAYGHNLIGQYASWIEAPLLKDGLWKKRSKSLAS